MHQVRANVDGSGIFIQVGAGAGDRDSRAHNRDGFTEFIKSLPHERVKSLVLVEPNPMNIPHLKECWKDYPEAIIVESAIVPTALAGTTLDFYYAPADGPHFQVASVNKSHVEKHYGTDAVIEKLCVPTIDLDTLIRRHVPYQYDSIELLALDIEGVDAEVILDTNFERLKVQFLSFEHLHLGHHHNQVMEHLRTQNMRHIGAGIDHNGFDLLYQHNTI